MRKLTATRPKDINIIAVSLSAPLTESQTIDVIVKKGKKRNLIHSGV
jgi:metal-responsive CopG/Arc/MetJ family transcriptional regulator